jgi:predicted DNA-binding transcriptional regulator YafY
MDRFERIRALHTLLLRHRYPLSVARIADALACSRATVYRSLDDLRGVMAEPDLLVCDPAGYRYDRTGGRVELPGLWLQPAEIEALLALDGVLQRMSPGLLGELLAPLHGHLERLLAHRKGALGSLRERIRLLPLAARESAPGVFTAVAAALAERHRLEIDYLALSTGRRDRREVSPQRLVRYRDNWYLDAWCHLRDGLRSFALDRILTATVLDRTASDVDEDRLDVELGTTYGIFAGPVTAEAVLRFDPEGARRIAGERWHPEQLATPLPGGGLELRIPYGNPTELVMDIARHGAAVKVVAPPALRAAVAAHLRSALGQYEEVEEGAGVSWDETGGA